MIKEEMYVAPEFEDLAAVEAHVGTYYDATTLRIYATCPRSFKYKVVDGLGWVNKPRQMHAGSAMHEAIDVYTITNDEDAAFAALKDYWADGDTTPVDAKFSHLTLHHLNIVLANYFDYTKTAAGMQYLPITFKMDEINFGNVLAAKLRILDGDTVLFGESSWLMALPVPFNDPVSLATMYYSGKPDMAVRSPSNNIYIMDHKTTSSYLSEWNFGQHRVSNQLRCYIRMFELLTGVTPQGGLINGIFVGAKASSDTFKGSRFARYKYNWQGKHIDEAVVNQYMWTQTVQRSIEKDNWPQAANTSCRGCDMGKLCDVEPDLRDGVVYTDYDVVGWRNFFDL